MWCVVTRSAAEAPTQRSETKMTEKSKNPTVQIVLTPEQREHVRQVTGNDVEVPKLKPEQLEERIAPLPLQN